MGKVNLTTLSLQIGALLTALSGAIGVFFAVRNHKRQLAAQIFMQYSAKYAATFGAFPPELWMHRLDPESLLPPPNPVLTANVTRAYYFLLEIFYLDKLRYVPRDIWQVWEQEFERTLSSPMFIREWRALSTEFATYPDFCKFVEAIQSRRGG